MQVSGSVVVITGGASGLGEEVAKDLSKSGAKIVLGDVNQEGLDRVVKDITDAGGEAVSCICDVTKDEDVEKMMDTAIDKFGAINIVFANAGIFLDSLMLVPDKETGKIKKMMTTDMFRKVIDINLTGCFVTVREGARRMVDNGCSGVILLTSSINHTGQIGQLNYSSTKASLALWPKILSGEFHARGIKNIRIAAISPGYTATPILTAMKPEILEKLVKDVHIGRLVEPAEIAATARFIIENDAIDATNIEVTGGLTYGPAQRAK